MSRCVSVCVGVCATLRSDETAYVRCVLCMCVCVCVCVCVSACHGTVRISVVILLSTFQLLSVLTGDENYVCVFHLYTLDPPSSPLFFFFPLSLPQSVLLADSASHLPFLNISLRQTVPPAPFPPPVHAGNNDPIVQERLVVGMFVWPPLRCLPSASAGACLPLLLLLLCLCRGVTTSHYLNKPLLFLPKPVIFAP